MITIKAAKQTDAMEIRSLLCKVWQDTFEGVLPEKTVTEVPLKAYDYKLLKSQLEDPAVKFLVAKDSTGKIIGVTNAKQQNEVIYINRLYIDRAYQRMGLGNAFINELIKQFPLAEKVVLEVVEKNAKGISFYLKNGFMVTGKNKSKIGDHVLDVLVLQKNLEQGSF
ncbi:MAG TPA: GNAT family N-acetyltransferase [Smithellaceae bacterium]|nr:GNAT family N-acetyltransferase [Smithellaceae bacterium]HRS88593.1 GNAT family N-acetyltransferase [Smithellaceae bacterium]HRV25347.1 GNAT family N-acetyltransferase [Smithellaceae bacterium]